MDYYVDTVSLVYPTVNWANVAPFEPKRQERKTLIGRTEFATATASSMIDFFRAVTGPLAPTAAPSAQAEPIAGTTAPLSERAVTPIAAAVVVPPNADVERIAKQRVQLMAAKYASGIESSEIVARLEILNRRLLERAPRVTKAHVSALEDAHAQLARIRATREERANRFGIAV